MIGMVLSASVPCHPASCKSVALFNASFSVTNSFLPASWLLLEGVVPAQQQRLTGLSVFIFVEGY